MWSQVTKAVQTRQTTNPRTVLGFYAIVIGLVLTGAVGSIAVLAATNTSEHLIEWILGFAAVVIIFLTVSVVAISRSDPSKLLLTQVSGTEYAAIQQHTIVGDSSTGERRGAIPPAPSHEPLSLPPPSEGPRVTEDPPTDEES